MTRVLRMLAALGVTAAVIGVPIGPVMASTTICVGIVVDYGVAKPGGGANSFCVRVAAGATGGDVLIARARALGRPAPTYRSDGLLCTIDGYPDDSSCGDPARFRFWSYWHQLANSSGWVCSQAGPNFFTVADGSVEGWSFQDGGPVCGRPPASYRAVCRAFTSPTPTASPPARPMPSRTPAASGVRRSTAPAAGRSGSPGAPRTTAGSNQATHSTTPGPTSTRSSAAASTTPSATPVVAALSPVEPPRGTRSRAPIATVAGVALAGGIGAAALRRTRGTRREGRG